MKSKPYLAAEQKIQQALQSRATEPNIRHPFIQFLCSKNKGEKHGA